MSAKKEMPQGQCSTLKTWVFRGMTAGNALASVEIVFALSSGYGMSVAYMVLVLVANTAAGTVFGAAIGLFIRERPTGQKENFASAFVPLATGVVCLFVLPKLVESTRFSSSPVRFGIVLLTFLALAEIVVYSLFRKHSRTTRVELSVSLSVFLVVFFLVSSEFFTRYFFVSYFSVGGMLTNGALVVALLIGTFVQDRLLAGRGGLDLEAVASPCVGRLCDDRSRGFCRLARLPP